MRRANARLLSLVASATAMSILAPLSRAGTNYTWTSLTGGTYNWSDNTNWTPVGVPSVASDSANLSVNMTGDLLVNLPTSETIGALVLGTTPGAFTTDIGNANAGGGTLTFDNTGGTGDSTITLSGAAGANNVISAPVVISNINLDVIPTTANNLSLTGGITITTGTAAVTRTLNDNLLAGSTLTIGNVTSSASGPLTAGITNLVQLGAPKGANALGTTIVNGVVSNGAPNSGFNVNTGLILGTDGAKNANLIPTIDINNANTYSGGTQLFKANVVLGTDTAFGTGGVKYGGGAASGAMGFNIASTDDARTIGNTFTMQRNLTVNGAHSITWTGTWTQSNTSNFFNLLPAGKTFTFTNTIATDTGSGRQFTFDGPGRTVVTGNIANNNVSPDSGSTGAVAKNGDGTVILSGAANTYSTFTAANGGLLEFSGSATTLGHTSQIIANPGGAAGLEAGPSTPGTTSAAFLNLLAASPQNNTGALALGSGDAAANLDFTTGTLGGTKLAGMSVGAVEGGVTYTGTITPAAGGYQLGGGGTLTVPGTNALTNAAGLTVTNGGAVALTGTNNYTGNTTIQGNYIVSNEQAAAANNGLLIQPGVYQASKLSISHIADGASSIGNPTNGAASNLVINGGTLQYVGSSSESTSRGFTVGPLGATIDSSGTGAVTFSNTGANVSADAGTVTGTTTLTSTSITGVSDVSQLAVGMTLNSADFPAGTTIVAIQPSFSATGTPNTVSYTVVASAAATTAESSASLNFTTQNRALNLTGSNTGSNTIAGALADSASGGQLSVNKSGAGTWVLSGANTYGGATNVQAGTLVLASTYTTGSALNVSDGATAQVGGTGTSIQTKALNLNSTGKLDVTTNSVDVHYGAGTSPDATIRSYAIRGYNGGNWAGTGITSSTAAADTVHHAVGYADGADNVVAGLASGDELIKYTFAGDANLDGKVDVSDLGILATNYGHLSGQRWDQGDFTYDGGVDVSDLGVLATNYGAGTGVSGAAAAAMFQSDLKLVEAEDPAFAAAIGAVPEPASLGLLGIGVLGILGRRRRSQRKDAI